MKYTLDYGRDSTLSLELPAGIAVFECGQPQLPAIADVRQATSEALAHPVDYPPLGQTAVPGDKVVLALGEALPQAAAIVAAVVEALLAAGIEPDDIAVLRSFEQSQLDVAGPLSLLSENLRASVRLLTHDPQDRNRLSYLAASAEAKPIFVNRALSEADLVVPIGAVRPEGALGYHGVYSALFPTFSDAKTIERYRSPIATESAVQRRRFRREVEETSWLLGVHFLLEVVPGPADTLLALYAGRASAVERASREHCARAWHCQVPGRAGLVVAGVRGQAGRDAWNQLARALAAASRVVESGGAIALCTDLKEELGPALRALLGAADRDLVMRHVTHDRPIDTFAAVQLVHALEHSQVYLLSGLDESVVEELGMTPIDSAEQIARLASRFDACVLLANAQYAVPTPENDAETQDEEEAVDHTLEEARQDALEDVHDEQD